MPQPSPSGLEQRANSPLLSDPQVLLERLETSVLCDAGNIGRYGFLQGVPLKSIK
jgi:hypothetical protein